MNKSPVLTISYDADLHGGMMRLWKKEDIQKKLRQDPLLICNSENLSEDIILDCFMNANINQRNQMAKHPRYYMMEEFFEKYPHLLLASDVGLLDE